MTVLGRAWRTVRWYVRALLGADAYERYLERYAAEHAQGACDTSHAPLAEREFWRQQADAMTVEARCC